MAAQNNSAMEKKYRATTLTILTKLIDKYQLKGHTTLVMGDFNSTLNPPHDKPNTRQSEIQTLTQATAMINAHTEQQERSPFHTFRYHSGTTTVIDYILIPKVQQHLITHTGVMYDDTGELDHAALTTTLNIMIPNLEETNKTSYRTDCWTAEQKTSYAEQIEEFLQEHTIPTPPLEGTQEELLQWETRCLETIHKAILASAEPYKTTGGRKWRDKQAFKALLEKQRMGSLMGTIRTERSSADEIIRLLQLTRQSDQTAEETVQNHWRHYAGKRRQQPEKLNS